MAKDAKKVKTKSADPKILSDLKAAAYNPRSITDRQLDAMVKSYFKFGDLSGVVYNVRTDRLIGGHQRTRIFKKYGKKSAIVKKPYSDKYGTTSLGYVDVVVADGKSKSVVRIPYREVRWDADTEKAANIAANAAGGEFDLVKLGKILKELEDRKFDIEGAVPIDPWMHRKSISMFESDARRTAEGVDEGGEFPVINPDDVEASLEHTCPRCGHRWSGVTKPSKNKMGGHGHKGKSTRVAVEKKGKVIGAKKSGKADKSKVKSAKTATKKKKTKR